MREVDWRAVEREVMRSISRRASYDRAREITQTALERAVAADHPDWSTIEVTCWAIRVAINLSIDDRRRRPVDLVADIPERVVVDGDVETLVMARLELAAVARALPMLTSRDRALVLDYEQGPAGDRRAQVRLAGARRRARERLRRLVDDAGVWIAGLAARKRAYAIVSHDSFTAAIVGIAVVAAQIVGHTPFEPAATFHDASLAHVPHRAARPARGSWAPTASIVPGAATDDSDKRVNGAGLSRGDAPERGHIDNPAGDGELWYWEDDPEKDDEPVECVWSAAVDEKVCTPVSWGDVRRVSPVRVPDTPW